MLGIKDFLTSTAAKIKTTLVGDEHIPHHVDTSLGVSESIDTITTPSDVTTYSGVRALYAYGGGVIVMEIGGVTRSITVWDGAWLPISPTKIKVGTTATGIVLFY